MGLFLPPGNKSPGLLRRKTRIGEFLIELVDTAGRVNKFHLTGKERMRIARDLQLDQRILLAIFPYDRILGRSARTRQKGLIAGKILENHESVIPGMDIIFHNAI